MADSISEEQLERVRFVASNPWLCSECGPVEADQVERENYASVHYTDDDESHLVTREGELAEDVAALLAAYEHAEARADGEPSEAIKKEIDWFSVRLAEVTAERDTAQASEARLRESIQRIYDELGEPTDLDYPAPVANAARIARAALQEETPHE